MFTGVIEGVGPRYCPSIEDKINRFADKGSHQIFLEPEGLSTTEFYPNGISTSLPFDVQLAAVRSIAGLEEAHIVRPGYAIEYDYFDPRALRSNFETQAIRGLFFAGQINGTTGYEEAAAQGLFAGVNAALAVRGEAQWVPARNEGYIGVLVDDLVSRGVTEPYRMFTSRAEFRLQLREDNADVRLTPTGRRLGLVDDERWSLFERKQAGVASELERLHRTRLKPEMLMPGVAEKLFGRELERDYSLAELLRRPGVSFDDVVGALPADGLEVGAKVVSRETIRAELGDWLGDAVIEQLQIELKYAGYVQRQIAALGRMSAVEDVPIPAEFDYGVIQALSHEARQVLKRRQPADAGRGPPSARHHAGSNGRPSGAI